MDKKKINYPKNRKSARHDLTGQKFGYLTAIKYDTTVNGNTKWLCQCECGNEVSVYIANIKRSSVTSCGCMKGESISKAKATKDLASKHPLWGCYNQMVRRCTVEKDKAYKNYGARGIKVCEYWMESFWNFLEDMGEKPSDEYSLERVDNSLGYCKENCKWETKSRQQFNRRLDPNNTSGRTGVYWRKDREKWSVQIEVEGKVIRLGCYFDFDVACSVRDKAELEYFGFIKE